MTVLTSPSINFINMAMRILKLITIIKFRDVENLTYPWA